MTSQVRKYLVRGAAAAILAAAAVAWHYFQFRNGTTSPLAAVSGYNLQPLGQGYSLANSNQSVIRDSNTWDKLKSYPDPSRFSYFDASQKVLPIFGPCRDAYYAVIIYPISVDYRDNPAGARYNTAKPCKKGTTFNEQIDLTALNLADGKYYYIVADQGNEGIWYNPR